MSYRTLGEILSKLDAQQRKEHDILSAEIDETERNRVLSDRKKLTTVAVFFIERSWESLAPRIADFSLEEETGKSTEELRTYLEGLHRRDRAFAWGWIRARMNARLMQWLEESLPDLLLQHPDMAIQYNEALRRVDHYWFRETPLHHLKAGYHTALGVACKWYGSTLELLRDSPCVGPETMGGFRQELRLFASFSMTMLVRTDRYLWDSAGAEPLDLVVEDGTLLVAERVVEQLALLREPDYGLRLGCPALRARRAEGSPAFAGIIDWVELMFYRYLMNSE